MRPSSNVNAERKILAGFIMLVASALGGWHFSENYYRMGPDVLEPWVLAIGSAAILATAGFGFLLLVRGLGR